MFFILRFYKFGIIGALKASDYKVPSRHVLKMIDKAIVNDRPAAGPEDGNPFCCHFLTDLYAESFGNFSDQSHQRWSTLFNNSFLGDKFRSFREGSCQRRTGHVIGSLTGIILKTASPQRKYFQASEPDFNIFQILSFTSGDVRYGAQHDAR